MHHLDSSSGKISESGESEFVYCPIKSKQWSKSSVTNEQPTIWETFTITTIIALYARIDGFLSFYFKKEVKSIYLIQLIRFTGSLWTFLGFFFLNFLTNVSQGRTERVLASLFSALRHFYQHNQIDNVLVLLSFNLFWAHKPLGCIIRTHGSETTPR